MEENSIGATNSIVSSSLRKRGRKPRKGKVKKRKVPGTEKRSFEFGNSRPRAGERFAEIRISPSRTTIFLWGFNFSASDIFPYPVGSTCEWRLSGGSSVTSFGRVFARGFIEIHTKYEIFGYSGSRLIFFTFSKDLFPLFLKK